MGIVLRIGIGMVHPVQNAIYTGAHIGRTLGDIGINKKESFPATAHGKSPVSGIAMVKKRLCKKGKIPVCNKEDKNIISMMWRTSATYVGIMYNRMPVEERFTKNVPDWNWFDRWGNTWWSRILWSAVYVWFYVAFAPSAWWYLLIPLHIAMGPIHGVVINWFAHKYGGVNFETDNTSKNLFKVDWLMLGEGYHNNHHKYPSRSNFAMKRGEFDPIYPVVKLLSKFKVIRVNNPKTAVSEY